MADQENNQNDNASDNLSGTNNQNSTNDDKKTGSKNENHRDFEKEIKDLNRENAKHRHRAKELEEQLQDLKSLLGKSSNSEEQKKTSKSEEPEKDSKFDDLEKSLNEKLNKFSQKLSEAEKRIEESDKRLINSKLEVEANKAGCVDYEIFSKLVDYSSLKISESGQVIGVHEQIASLKKAKPFLFDNRSIRNTSAIAKIPSPDSNSKKELPDWRTDKGKRDYQKEKNALISKYK